MPYERLNNGQSLEALPPDPHPPPPNHQRPNLPPRSAPHPNDSAPQPQQSPPHPQETTKSNGQTKPPPQQNYFRGHKLTSSFLSPRAPNPKIPKSVLHDDEFPPPNSLAAQIFRQQTSSPAARDICRNIVGAKLFQGTCCCCRCWEEAELSVSWEGCRAQEDEGIRRLGADRRIRRGVLIGEGRLARLHAGNVVPFGEPKSHEMQQRCERETDRRFAESKETLAASSQWWGGAGCTRDGSPYFSSDFDFWTLVCEATCACLFFGQEKKKKFPKCSSDSDPSF